MKKREIPVMNVGISLIILIFMNICLAAFAVLSLQNALSDYSLSQKTATHTTQYYAAVNRVQEQLAVKNQELREKQEEIQKKQEEIQKKQEQQKKQQESQKTGQNTAKKAVSNQKTEIKNTKQKGTAKQISKAQLKKKIKEAVKAEAEQQIILTENVSKRQQLVVVLQLNDTGEYLRYYIKKWQLCSPENWQADDSLDVYQGSK